MIISFTIFYLSKKNYEFLLYVGVIVFFLVLIILTNPKVNYSNIVLWGLTFWGFLHMAGGSLKYNGEILYKFMIIPLSESYQIFKFDQFVHIVGFGVATLIMYELLKPLLKENLNKWVSVSIVVIMAGLGVGAINEIIEFFATVIVPETGVGGYINTSLDLVADLIGASLAMIIIKLKEK